MGSFHGYSSLITILFFFFFFFFCLVPLSTFGWSSNPLVELSSRSELVELAGYGEEKLSSVLVTGSVLCESCLGGEDHKHSFPVSGALVGVSCKTGGRKMKLMNWVQERTDEYGEFMIDLPSHLHAIPSLDKACIVRVLRMPKNSPCKRVSVGKPKGLKLSSVGNNIRAYTVGSLRFQFQRGACIKEAK